MAQIEALDRGERIGPGSRHVRAALSARPGALRPAPTAAASASSSATTSPSQAHGGELVERRGPLR